MPSDLICIWDLLRMRREEGMRLNWTVKWNVNQSYGEINDQEKKNLYQILMETNRRNKGCSWVGRPQPQKENNQWEKPEFGTFV